MGAIERIFDMLNYVPSIDNVSGEDIEPTKF